MNIHQLLNYRPICFIHNKNMAPFILSPRFSASGKIDSESKDNYLKASVVEGGLLLKMKGDESPDNILINLDGNYNIPKKPALKRVIENIFTVVMACPECKNVPIVKSRNIGLSTLMDIKYLVHTYSFSLRLEYGKSTCVPLSEVIKFHRKNKFYHMDATLDNGTASFKMGSCDDSTVLDDLLSGLMCLDVPKFDSSKIKNIDQLVDKIKLYNLFS